MRLLKNFSIFRKLEQAWYAVAGLFTDRYRLIRWQEGVIHRGFAKAFEAGRVAPKWVEAPDVYVSDFGTISVIPNRFIKAPVTYWQKPDGAVTPVPHMFSCDYPLAYPRHWLRAWDRSLGGMVYYAR